MIDLSNKEGLTSLITFMNNLYCSYGTAHVGKEIIVIRDRFIQMLGKITHEEIESKRKEPLKIKVRKK